jgi:hypothetical protein
LEIKYIANKINIKNLVIENELETWRVGELREKLELERIGRKYWGGIHRK